MIYPSQKLKIKLPISMRNLKYATISPKTKNIQSWMKARNLPVSNGCISVVHEGSNPVSMTKNEHIADVFACKDVAVENLQTPESIQKIYDLGREDLSHLYQARDIDGENSSYLEEISIDPDNVLTPDWRNRFASICKDFSNIITPKPGKYNGYYGRIDNSINFCNTPPPSIRAHLSKYSMKCCK